MLSIVTRELSVLDEKGDLIGIVFAGIQQYEGLNFAVPYSVVEKALPALFKGGRRCTRGWAWPSRRPSRASR